MTDQQLTDQHRRQALDRLAQIERELASIASWLAQLGEDDSAIPLELAAQSVAAGAWRLEGPRRVTRSPRLGP